MSLRLFEDDVLFMQRLLKAEGLYVGELDGIWGPLTSRAVELFAEDGSYLTDAAPYERAAEAGLVEGLQWGGHFRRFVDRPHYQLQLGFDVGEVRARFEAGVPYTPAGVLDDGIDAQG